MKVKIIDNTENPIITIYKAYRICYSKDVPTEIKIPIKKDIQLVNCCKPIDYDKMLDFIKLHSNHQSPLEHISFTFAIEGVSRITEQQLTRHRIGASYSIQSGRYVNKSNVEPIIPKSISNNKYALAIFEDAIISSRTTYDMMVALGIPKEDARYVMPQGQATNIIMTMNARELIHFFQERLCIRAQNEIREMAELMRREVNEILPIFDRKDIMRCSKTCNECDKDDNEEY
jgi:thymidylate synthase (FAD)